MTSKSGKGVLLALSGGVDSSVCAHLLRSQGLRVEAVVCEFSPAHRPAVEAARRTAGLLGIPLHVIQCHQEFEERVISYFARSYLDGETPNPCVVCNPLVKFRAITEKAEELGLRYTATGHYADIAERDGRYMVKKAGFLPRDQSYMLYRLDQRQLRRLLLPLAQMNKDEVRALARELSLPCADAPDSQEICFIPDGDYPRYIEERYGQSVQGNFISPEGTPCGKHKGIIHYTVGQRKGLGIALGRPVFIRRIDPQTGNIYLAEAGQEFFSRLILRDCVWQPFDELPGAMELEAKIRSQARPAAATVSPLGGGRAEVVLSSPQRAPAPGQSCVLYQGDLVYGGGFIETAE